MSGVLGPNRCGELWVVWTSGSAWAEGRFSAPSLVVDSFASDGRGYGQTLGAWTHRLVDLQDGSSYEAHEAVLLDARSGWRRL